MKKMNDNHIHTGMAPWNKGKLIGQKPPLRLHEIWSIRIRLEVANKIRDLALFNLAIDSKLRSCDLVKPRVSDIAHGKHILKRAMVKQQKTQRPVQFEITEKTRAALTRLSVKNPKAIAPDIDLIHDKYDQVVTLCAQAVAQLLDREDCKRILVHKEVLAQLKEVAKRIHITANTLEDMAIKII